MTPADLTALLDFHYWARDRVLDAVDQLSTDAFLAARGNSFPSIRDTLAHVYFAEWAWYSRWTGNSPTVYPSAEQFTTATELRGAWSALEEQVRALIDPMSEAELNEVKPYRLFSGATGASKMWHMVQHMVNHATYHRGQVTTMLRQAGAQPAKSMDLITFYRERAL